MRFVAPRHPILFACAVALALAAAARAAQVEIPASAAYAPSQVVVKLVPDAGGVATRAIGPGFRALTGQAASQSLDTLFSAYGVQHVRRVFHRFEDGNGRLVRTTRDSVRARLARSAFKSSAALDAQLAGIPDLEDVFVLDLEGSADVRQAVAAFRQDENVVWAEPNWVYRASAEPLPAVPFVPNDRYVTHDGATWSEGAFGQAFPDLYGLRNTRAIEGWNVLDADGNGSFDAGETRPGEAVVVAVIDSGVDPAHPDLAGNLWVNPGEIPDNGIDDDGNGLVDDVSGWDFVDDDRFPSDPHGHGTHVAGTIAALTNNAVGVAGVAPYARIMPVRGLNANGSGLETDLAAGVEYAAAMGAGVTSNSWGGLGSSQLLDDAFAAAEAAGVLNVAAAGNDDSDVSAQTPANLDSVMAVAAVDSHDVRASFSNFGELVEISAPGVDVLSLNANQGNNVIARTLPGNVVGVDYLHISGTSMACPHVSGAAAVLRSAFPTESPVEIRARLMVGSQSIDAENPDFKGRLGAGRVDLRGSLTVTPSPLLRLVDVTALNVRAGQQAAISVSLRNFWVSATHVTAVLSTTDPHASVDRGTADFGNLPMGESANNGAAPFLVSFDPATPFGAIPFTLSVSADGGVHATFELSLSLSFMSDATGLAGVPKSGVLPFFTYFQDYSGDGFPDILLIDFFDLFLYRNQGDGTFLRRNNEAGVPRSYNAWTSHFLDVDNDGDRDILIGGNSSLVAKSKLLLNQGDGTTVDISDSSGFGSRGLEYSAALDYNGDGWIDVLGGQGSGPPPLAMQLMENQGDLTFVDRLAASGLPRVPTPNLVGRVATLDYDNDGDPDVLFTSPGVPPSLWRNNGDGTFSDVTAEAFPTFLPPSVAGVALGDCDNDGDVDLFVTDIPTRMNPPNRILINEGGVFRDAGDAAGDIAAYNFTGLWWGNEFFDFDNDGHLDLFVSKDVTFPGTTLPALDRNALFRNDGSCHFTLINDQAFPANYAGMGGAAAMADYDGDGDIDVYAPGGQIIGRTGALLRNELGDKLHWLKVALEGTRSNRDGYGARVTLEAGGLSQMREIASSAVDPSVAHFGLGAQTVVDRLEVRWPSGIHEVFRGIGADQTFRVVEVDCGTGRDRNGDGVCDLLTVAIDIEPGQRVASINPKSHGLVRVALLGSHGFDVAQVDKTTLAFGPSGAAPVHEQERCGEIRDVNRDGYPDLISQYSIPATGIGSADTEACVTGALRNGMAFEGCEAIRVKPAHP